MQMPAIYRQNVYWNLCYSSHISSVLNHFYNHVGPIEPRVISSNDGGSYEFIGHNFPEVIYAENEQKQNYKQVYT